MAVLEAQQRLVDPQLAGEALGQPGLVGGADELGERGVLEVGVDQRHGLVEVAGDRTPQRQDQLGPLEVGLGADHHQAVDRATGTEALDRRQHAQHGVLRVGVATEALARARSQLRQHLSFPNFLAVGLGQMAGDGVARLDGSQFGAHFLTATFVSAAYSQRG